MKHLYFIHNIGCDDSTRGLVRIPDEQLNDFVTFIKNLNKNSYYGCMPKIEVYKILDENLIREAMDEDPAHLVMHLDGKRYVISQHIWSTEFEAGTKLIVDIEENENGSEEM